MSACPNCGQKTARTEDWACQWCGYPLLSGFYKKIPRTYKQLQEEKRYKPLVVEEAEPLPPPEPVSWPPVDIMETEPVAEPKPLFVPQPIIDTEPVSAPKPAAIEVTVDDLISAYEEDGAAADARFTNRILNVTGVVARVEISQVLDVHYIILASADERRLQSIRCLFDKKYEPELSKLTKGQTVTVQGKYDGSIIDIRLKDCVIVG